MIHFLFPWQLRSSDTRPEKILRSSELSGRGVKMVLKIVRVLGNPIGRIALEVVPDKFIRIKFRSVPRKKVRMNTMPMFSKEVFDHPGFVNGSPVPEKNKAFLLMPKKVLEKCQDFGTLDIPQGVKANVELNPPAPGRYADRGDSRDLRPTTGTDKDWRLSFGRPSPSDTGNQAKAALIEKNKREFKFFGLFLYEATDIFSNVLFLLHSFALLSSQVSDSSNPCPSENTKYYWGDRIPQNAHQSPWRFFALSKDRWNTRSLEPLSKGYWQGVSSGARLVFRVFPGWGWALNPHLLFLGADASRNKPNFLNNQSFLPYLTDSFLYPAALRPAGVALQAVLGFHGFSWKQFTTKKLYVPLFLRGSIVYNSLFHIKL